MNKLMTPFHKLSSKQRLIWLIVAALCLIIAFWIRTETYRTWIRVTAIAIMVLSLLMIGFLLAPVGARTKPVSDFWGLQVARLRELAEAGQEKTGRIGALVKELFGASSLTAAKFTGAAQSALNVLVNNVTQAERAARAFGSEEPTKEREEVFGGYLKDSQEVLKQLDRLALLLVQFDQSQDRDAETVTDQVQEIADTIHLYEKTAD